jgi:hypothetical protein
VKTISARLANIMGKARLRLVTLATTPPERFADYSTAEINGSANHEKKSPQ